MNVDRVILVKMCLELISNYHSIFFFHLIFFGYRCIPQNCTFGEKFNAFYGRCEKIQCQPGFNVTLFGKCIDINECAQKPSPCKLGERCDNTPGSYKCVQTFACANGLQMKDLQCLGKNFLLV